MKIVPMMGALPLPLKSTFCEQGVDVRDENISTPAYGPLVGACTANEPPPLYFIVKSVSIT